MNKLNILLNKIGVKLLISHRRFPVTVLASLAASFCFYFSINSISNPNNQIHLADSEMERWIFIKMTMLSLLAIPISFCLHLWSQQKRKYHLVYWLVAIVFFILFSLTSVWKGIHNELFIIRFIVFSFAAHFLVAIAPYFFNSNTNAFWQYNKTLLINILTAFVYSVVLSGGLSLALLAIEKLFNVDVHSDAFQFIWIFFNGYFSTVFFLSNFPESLSEFEEKQDYPIALKYFTQYVLLPLVIVYIFILFAYSGKILIEWNLPKGWVSNLVLASAIFGILAFLLIHPLKESSNWVKQFNRLFYFVLLPLIILLFVAIYVRIGHYGITEPRYFVALLAIWLAGITFYFILSKKDDIRMIPASLFVFAFLSVVGPWSAFSVSNQSQLKRFKTLLESNKLMKNGKVISSKVAVVSNEAKADISESLQYFADYQHYKALEPIYEQSFVKLDTMDEYSRKKQFHQWTGDLPMTNLVPEENTSYSFMQNQNVVKNIKGYDFLIQSQGNFNENQKQIFKINEKELTLQFIKNSLMEIEIGNEKFIFDFNKNINQIIDNQGHEYLVKNPEFLNLDIAKNKHKIEIQIKTIDLLKNKQIDVNNISIDIFIKML